MASPPQGKFRAQLNIPVIYLTAYSDDRTLQRAKITEPFGYILKPFREKDLHANIKMALYKAEMAKKGSQKVKNKAKKIFIVDGHPIMRQGLSQLINQEADLCVCGEAEDAPEALEAIAALKPELVIVDSFLKKISSLELIKDIKRYDASLPILVLSMHDESLYAERALRAGATGYVMKQEKGEKVLMAIRQIMVGDIYVSDKIGGKIMKKFFGERFDQPGSGDLEKLSDREFEVFHLICTGQKTSQIAEKLHLSVKTIDTYRANIKKKFDLKDANEVLQRAIQCNQIQDTS